MKKLVMINSIAIMQAIIYILLFNLLSMPGTTITGIILFAIVSPFMILITYTYVMRIIYEIQKIIKERGV